MTNTLMLNKIIKESGLKKEYLAKSMGLSRYGLSKKINNQSEFTAYEIDSMCNLLSISSLEDRFSIFFSHHVE